jgi:hypothetical protein
LQQYSGIRVRESINIFKNRGNRSGPGNGNGNGNGDDNDGSSFNKRKDGNGKRKSKESKNGNYQSDDSRSKIDDENGGNSSERGSGMDSSHTKRKKNDVSDHVLYNTNNTINSNSFNNDHRRSGYHLGNYINNNNGNGNGNVGYGHNVGHSAADYIDSNGYNNNNNNNNGNSEIFNSIVTNT